MQKKTINNSVIKIVILILVGLIVNVYLAQLISYFNLPLYLDSIGTIFIGATCGYLPGIIVGYFSNTINSIGDPITLYYGIISVIFAIISTYFTKTGFFRKWWKIIITIFIFAFVGGFLGSLLTWFIYGLNFGEGMSAPFAIYI